MKKNSFLVYIVLQAFLACWVLSGCKEDIELGSFVPLEPSVEIGADGLAVGKNDSSFVMGITSNLPWRAKSTVDWILVDDATHRGLEGNYEIKLSVKKNPGEEPRTGSIVIWVTSDYEKEITVTQAAGDPPPDVKTHIYVKVNGTGDGSSWSAATTLDAALAVDLQPGDFIHIAAGVYKPTALATGGGTDADKSFEIRGNINLIGGYPADATDGALSDPSINVTAFDGDNLANHVVVISAPPLDGQVVLLQGITIQKGNAVGTGALSIGGIEYPKNFGGGLIVAKSALELDQCVIMDNTALSGGGAIYAFGGAAVDLRNSVVKNTTATASGANGGALFINNVGTTFRAINSSLTGNAAGGFAGALYVYSASFDLFNTTIDGNSAGGAGSAVAGKYYGGVYLREGKGNLVNCTVYGNTCSGAGGGIGVYGTASAPATLNIISTTITGNKAIGAGNGGGIYVNATSANAVVTLYNSILSGNTGGPGGTENVSDAGGAAGYALGKKYSVVSAQVFDANEALVAGATFDFASMLGALSNNGGATSTCKLTGSGNPAKQNGMSNAQLIELGNGITPAIPGEVIAYDQTGTSREGKSYIGSCVKE